MYKKTNKQKQTYQGPKSFHSVWKVAVTQRPARAEKSHIYENKFQQKTLTDYVYI